MKELNEMVNAAMQNELDVDDVDTEYPGD